MVKPRKPLKPRPRRTTTTPKGRASAAEAAKAARAVRATQAMSGISDNGIELRDDNVVMPNGYHVVRLSDRERKFVLRYLVHHNATRAAFECGIPASEAASQAAVWMANRNVAQVIRDELDLRAQRYAVTADRIIAEMACIAFSNVGDFINVTSDGDPYIDLSGLEREQWAAISEATVDDYYEGRGENARQVKRVKVKTHDKMKALENLGKRLRLFPDSHEHTGAGGEDLVKGKLVDAIIERFKRKQGDKE